MKILIVDDSEDSRLLVSKLLESADHHDIVALDSARSAFEYLGLEGETPQPSPPDLILMDILMPSITGIEASRRIKAQESVQDIPIIMVTAKSEMGSLQEAFAAGAMDFISKPLHEIELLARVNSALALKKETDQRKAREQELRESNEALQQALRDVKVLRGFIPICASCKKIRNDQGAWQRLEEYLHEHSDAEFSHGLCAVCIKNLYPGVYKE